MKKQEPNYILWAVFYVTASILHTMGYELGLWILIALLSFFSFIFIFSTIVLFNLVDTEGIGKINKKFAENIPVRILIQCLGGIAIYQLYMHGFLFLSGLYSVAIGTMFLLSVYKLIFNEKEN